MAETQASYDRVAAEYGRQFSHELDHKPLEREMLDRFAASVTGRICDLGCGPGQTAAYLHMRGTNVFGLDLSPGMIEQARRLHPDITFEQGDMRALKLDTDSLGGIVAFYCIIHIPRGEVTDVLQELKRVLKPGGRLLVGFHRGQGVLHRDELWGKAVSLDFTLFEAEEMNGYLQEAGFTVEEIIQREPYPEIEYPSQRAYLFARKA
jgi:SAM-dependent methyltransferase